MADTCSFTFNSTDLPESHTEDMNILDWSCTHETHNDSAYCIFHMPLDEQSERELSPDLIGDALQKIAECKGSEQKRIIGARLNSLVLHRELLEATDKHPIDLRFATVNKSLTLNKSEVDQPIDLRGAEIEHLECRETEFNSEVRISGSTIGSCDLFRATFYNKVDFSQVSFRKSVNFEGTSFHDETLFRGVDFHGDALFKSAEFCDGGNPAERSRMVIDFSHGKFRGQTIFEQAIFAKGVFTQTIFRGETNFTACTFIRDAVFDDTRFCATADFSEGRFKEDSNFTNAVFSDESQFIGAEFHGGENVQDEDVTFANATFSEDVNFCKARFRGAKFTESDCKNANFSSTVFEREAKFDGMEVENKVRFDGARFNNKTVFDGGEYHTIIFDESRFADDASFENVIIRSDVSFRGAEFQGGDNAIDKDLTFSGSNLLGSVDFYRAKFGFVDFSQITFGEDVVFNQAEFLDKATFSESIFHGAVHFKGAEFKSSAHFSGTEFQESISFESARFHTDVSFEMSVFEDKLNCKEAQFRGGGSVRDDRVSFEDVVFKGSVKFNLAEFEHIVFNRAEFKEPTSFNATEFLHDGEFEDVIFRKKADFEESRFNHDARFESAQFEGKTYFTGVEFEGGRYERDAVSFENATFAQEVDFTKVNFGKASFFDAEFCCDACFEDSEFSHEANFSGAYFDTYVNFRNTDINNIIFYPETSETHLLVDLSDATLHEGNLGQTEQGDVFYDCTGGVLHEITLDDKYCNNDLFGYFRFCRTDFESFSIFDGHKEYLSQNNWSIHQFILNDTQTDFQKNTDMSPDEIEDLYLRAKKSAQSFGDPKATAEFFINEMNYRRLKNWKIATGRSNPNHMPITSISRLRAFGKYIGNYTLYQTCGYGERIWRVLYVSSIFILIWGFMYATLTQGTRGQGSLSNQGLDSLAQLLTLDGWVIIGKNMYFSMVTFTTLGYGDIQPIGTTARTLAGLEAFVGGLLIALVVFVLGRRVSR